MEAIGADRITQMLKTALGPEAGGFLLDTSVSEIMVNPDGKLWIESTCGERRYSGVCLGPKDVERVIYVVASGTGQSCSYNSPLLSAKLPGSSARFQGLLPPVVETPSFVVRKHSINILSLDDYVATGILSAKWCQTIKDAVRNKDNVLIVGGTGSGKTTLANAILAEIAKTSDRVVIIEDTKELKCSSADYVSLKTDEGSLSLSKLVKATMRLRPDRIVIGEVRGPEALDLLKAWNTGHPGGCTTVHADSARKGLRRLEQLIQEAGVTSSNYLIGETIDLVLFIEKTESGREVTQLLKVSWVDGDYELHEER